MAQSQSCCNFTFEKLSSDELRVVELQAYPKKSDQNDFLQETYENDKKTLDELGITYTQIADAMETIVGKYCRSTYLNGIYGKILVEDKYEIDSIGYVGMQECPLQSQAPDSKCSGYKCGDLNITIKNIHNGRSIQFNVLLIHIIRTHHFFANPKSLCRLDPFAVIETLELKKDVDYIPKYLYYYEWLRYGSANCPGLTNDDMSILEKIALKTYQISEKTAAYLFPYTAWLSFRDGVPEYVKNNYQNFNWREFLKIYLREKNDSCPEEEIEYQINSIMETIDKYQQTGNFKKMNLVVVSAEYATITIEGINIYDCWAGMTIYRLAERRYIPLSDEN